MKSTWHLTLTDHFHCKITDNLSIFSHLLCRAFVSHDLNNRKIRLKQCDKLKLIAMCIILFAFFLRLCGAEVWYNCERSEKPYDNKDEQHNQVL